MAKLFIKNNLLLSTKSAGVAGVEALLRRVGQKRTLRELGVGPELEASIVSDALNDEAIENSPRLPSAHELVAILAAVRG